MYPIYIHIPVSPRTILQFPLFRWVDWTWCYLAAEVEGDRDQPHGDRPEMVRNQPSHSQEVEIFFAVAVQCGRARFWFVRLLRGVIYLMYKRASTNNHKFNSKHDDIHIRIYIFIYIYTYCEQIHHINWYEQIPFRFTSQPPSRLYYWDDRDGVAFSGWWFGPKIGGDQAWGDMAGWVITTLCELCFVLCKQGK